MGRPAAKHGDRIRATDTHLVRMSGGAASLPHTFVGFIDGALSSNVYIMGRPAATAGSTADNRPAHFPMPPGTGFLKPPANRGTIMVGSPTVLINGKPAARDGDVAMTCNDPVDLPVGKVIASGTVLIG